MTVLVSDLPRQSGRSQSHFRLFLSLPHIFQTIRLGLTLLLSLVLAFLATAQGHSADLALVGAKIYLSPSEPPIESGTILVHNGHILSVGPIAEIKAPSGSTVIDCKGLVVTAGFWNSHVHILLPGLLHAEKLSSGADHVTTSTDAHPVGIHYRL